MKLKSVTIADYKCIRKPCRFDVSDITCLVGKNESGKTAVLEALYRLNPVVSAHGDFNVDDDYPRVDVEDYRLEVETGQGEPAVVTWATFSLDEEDAADLNRDFPGILTGHELVLSKGYANELRAELDINEERSVEALVKKAGIGNQQARALARCSTVQDLASSLKAAETDASPSRELANTANEIAKGGMGQYLFERYLAPRVPKFLYFDEFYQMKGHVNIEALIQRKERNQLLDSDYPLLGIIDLARLNLMEIVNPKRALERGNRLEGASNHLTKNIMKYWSQNRFLEMRFDIRPGLPEDPPGMQSGTNLWCQVYNARQKVSTLLGRRSRGFIWFFSFLAWFSQQKRRDTRLILLLDEPSLYLHATAQWDLLRFLEDECEAGLQVLYTTQSPYMIDPERFDRVRILEDRGIEADEVSSDSREGTQIFADFVQARKESMLPLEGALGHSLSRTLFPGTNLLLVNGIHDLIYLQTMSGLLTETGRRGLDPRWAITPMGGSQKLPVFVTLLGAKRETNMASLLGAETGAGDKGGKSPHEPLRRSLLQKEYIFSYGDFAESPVADVEDMFEPDFFLYLVNSAYLEVITKPIARSQIRKKNRKIAEVVGDYMDSLPTVDHVRFSRYRPARFFLEHGPALKAQISASTFGRFEKLFASINVVLG